MNDQHVETGPLSFSCDPASPTQQLISHLLRTAQNIHKENAVAHHLVGATLQIRFPETRIDNKPFNEAEKDVSNYRVGDTDFYVRANPFLDASIECHQGIENPSKVYLLTLEEHLADARAKTEPVHQNSLTIESVESFVGLIIEFMSAFSRDGLTQNLRCLLETHNKRVNEVESDKSILVEIPYSLLTEGR